MVIEMDKWPPMDFAELANRTGMDVRKLRYVLDYSVLPKYYVSLEDRTSTSHGVPRQFSPFLGFCIALTAALREGNLTRERAQQALQLIIEWAKLMVADKEARSRPMKLLPLILLFAAEQRILAEIGDCRFLRIRAERAAGKTSRNSPKPSGWVEIDTGKQARKGFEPFIVTSFSVSMLARRLK